MEKYNIERRKNMINIMSQNEEFIIVGLTGRIGSGCTETAKILASDFQNLELPWIQPGSNGIPNDEEREKRILQRYASSHWIKFDVIRTRAIISSFLLDCLEEFLLHLNKNNTVKVLHEKMIDYIRKDKWISGIIASDDASIDSWNRELLSLVKSIKKSFPANAFQSLKYNEEYFNEITELIKNNKFQNILLIEKCTVAANELGKLYHLIETTDEGNSLCERGRFIPLIEKALGYLSQISAAHILTTTPDEQLLEVLKSIRDSIDTSSLEGACKDTDALDRYRRFVFVHDIVDIFADTIHEFIDESQYTFTELYQKYGNCIRCYGRIYLEKPAENAHQDNNAINIFSIPNKIVQFIKILRHPFSGNDVRPVRIVIDSIKSVFEADYLRQRYSSFYLFAISTDNEIRKQRLMSGENRHLTMQQIKYADWNEYSSEGYKIFNAASEDSDEKLFAENINRVNCSFSHDYVREHAYKNKLYQFYLQDVAASIENADIFISNNYNNTISKNMELRWAVVRNICLIMFPGLLVPTPIERCMQIAFAAKCNSGCLSRQVGAVVTDKEYNILSIGWNDVPCGDVSCSHKNLVDLCKWEDKAAYSKYELEDIDFRKRISGFKHQSISKILIGLPMRYCFKDIHSDTKNPMRSRSMHAEEKALALCGEMCRDGYLFTTSSPCEMCSKNAKNHRIKKIFYIELYPGISETQYTHSGDKNNIAEHVLFTGAIGRAYTKMYTPFMPQKDILDMLGVYDECMKKF